jgi:hypothetical protein
MLFRYVSWFVYLIIGQKKNLQFNLSNIDTTHTNILNLPNDRFKIDRL